MLFIKNISNKLASLNDVVLVILIAFIAYFIKIPAVMINETLLNKLGITQTLFMSDQQIPEITFISFFLSVLIAPSAETFVAQFLPIKLARKFSANIFLTLIFSSFVFSLLHLPVIGFLFPAFCIGIIFAWFYVVREAQDPLKAFILVSASHSLHNLIAFLTVLILQGSL
jgi:membrane protease YdiL (CAAX protease family)